MTENQNVKTMATKKPPKKRRVGLNDLAKEFCAKNIGIQERMTAISNDQIHSCLLKNRVGDAELYNTLFRDYIVYVQYWDRFLVWTGSHWAEDDNNMAWQCVELVCQLYLRLADALMADFAKTSDKEEKSRLERDALEAIKRAKLLRDVPGQCRLLEMTHKIENPLMCQPSQIDCKPYVKACSNCVIDLRSGEALAGNPKDYLLNAIPIKYSIELFHSANPCPETEKFLLASMDGNQALVDFLWRLFGYILITKRRDNIFVIFHGEHGRNGKDTLMKLMKKVLGKALSVDAPIDMILQNKMGKNSSGPAPDVMLLRGACVAWLNEAEDNQYFATGALKKLTGGGDITGRYAYEKTLTSWEQTHLFIMCTNELPKVKASDYAFWYRAVIVKWPLSFVDDPDPAKPYERKADKDLDVKLEAEIEGVLARMARGAVEYMKNGLQIPEFIKAQTRAQRDEYDFIQQFIDDLCEIDPDKANRENSRLKGDNSQIYQMFACWHKFTYGGKTPSQKFFGSEMSKKGFESSTSGRRIRRGIDLLDFARRWLGKFDEKNQPNNSDWADLAAEIETHSAKKPVA